MNFDLLLANGPRIEMGIFPQQISLHSTDIRNILVMFYAHT